MKKITALILATIMLFALAAGCSQDGSEPSQPPDSSPSQSPSAAPAADPSPSDEPSNGMPLADGDVTFSFWWPLTTETVSFVSDLSDNILFQEMEKITGVKIDFISPSPVSNEEQFNLMVVSEEWTDLIKDSGRYPGGVSKAVGDGFIYDLTDYMDEYAPNYMAIVNSDQSIRRNVTTDDSRFVSFAQLRDRQQSSWMGLLVRNDWLEDLSLEIPQTFDDWHTTLTAFKDNKTGGYGPLQMAKDGTFYGNTITGSFGVAGGNNAFCLDYETGKVMLGQYHPRYREYLELMRDWYSEGLIDQDFVSRTENMHPVTALLSEDLIGAYTGIFNQAGTFFLDSGTMTNPDFFLELAPRPVNSVGDTVYVGNYAARAGSPTGAAITKACTEPEIAVQWFDYIYSEEGTLLANYGVEGVTFEYREDGKPFHTDLILNNPEGMLANGAQQRYLMHTGPHHFIQDREDVPLEYPAIKYVELWPSNYPCVLPSLSLNAEDSAERSEIMADVNTFIEEWTVKFIMGMFDLDTQWDSYMQQLKDMNVERAIELTQQAYDRYLAK